MQVFSKLQRRLTITRHAPFQGEIRKVVIAQQLGFLLPQFKNFPDERRIIKVAITADGAIRLPDFTAQVIIIGILQHRPHRRILQGEAPLTLVSFALCICGSRRLGGLR